MTIKFAGVLGVAALLWAAAAPGSPVLSRPGGGPLTATEYKAAQAKAMMEKLDAMEVRISALEEEKALAEKRLVSARSKDEKAKAKASLAQVTVELGRLQRAERITKGQIAMLTGKKCGSQVHSRMEGKKRP